MKSEYAIFKCIPFGSIYNIKPVKNHSIPSVFKIILLKISFNRAIIFEMNISVK